ncbi:MAG: hypothetical protein U0414_10825 [Polyangiaceae bacterium]
MLGSRLATVAVAAFAAGGAATLVIAACGTSVSSRYESDVRFERCMALDWQGDVDPQIRQGCWDEWVRYFTRGQTRDRIAYAKKELEKLGSTEVASASVSAEATPHHAIPEPTSVFTPPPMMMTVDAGATTDGGIASADAGDGGPPPKPLKNDCMRMCDDQSEQCERSCTATWCMKSCAVQRAKCVGFCP